jgi:hypothetical protein
MIRSRNLDRLGDPSSLQEVYCDTGTSSGARSNKLNFPAGTMYVVTQVPMHPYEPRIMVTVSQHLAVLRDRGSLFDTDPTRQGCNNDGSITKVEYKYP